MNELSDIEIQERIFATNANPWVKLAREGVHVWNGFMRAHMGEKRWSALIKNLPKDKEFSKEIIENLFNTEIMRAEVFDSWQEKLRNTIYNSKANYIFSKHIFQDMNVINFSEFVFYGRVRFIESVFEEASFENTIFCDDVDFSKSTILSYTGFESAIFMRSAIFTETKFKDEATFRDAYFLGDTRFDCAEFAEKVNFVDAEFLYVDESASFQKAIFLKEVDFAYAEFKRATFIGAKFETYADFYYARFNWPPHFEGVKANVIFFRGTIINQNSDIERLHLTASAWQALIRLAEESKDLRQAQKFHQRLLEVEQKFETEESAWMLYEIYSVLGSGRSVLIPLIWLIFLCIHMSYFYWVFIEKITATKAFAFSLVSTVPFITHSKNLVDDIPHNIIFQIAGGLHTTASLILIFLIGLALRNRFRVK